MPVLMTHGNRYREAPREKDSKAAKWQLEYLKKRMIPFEAILAAFERLNETVREVARENDALLIDLGRRMPGTPANFYDTIHHTEAGSVLQAELVARALVKQIRGSP